MAGFFIDSLNGSDSNNGTSPTPGGVGIGPWASIAKLNSSWASIHPGDTISLAQQSTFLGPISPTINGASGTPITINSYVGASGAGANPNVNGFAVPTGWTSVGTNLWRSAVVAGSQSRAMIVTIGGTFFPMGKYPHGNNTNDLTIYRAFSSATGIGAAGSTITDAAGIPAGSPIAIGAEVVIRRNNYTIHRGTITNVVGNVITYTGLPGMQANGSPFLANYGYFVQNSLSVITQSGVNTPVQNEWYWDNTAKQLYISSTTTPTNVKVSILTNVVVLTNRSFINFQNITFEGSCDHLILADGASNIIFNGCTVNLAGNDGISQGANGLNNFTFQNGTINNCNTIGIFAGNTNNVGNVVTNTNVTNIGVFPGMCYDAGGSGGVETSNLETCCGLLMWGGVHITNCNIQNCGYAGIYHKGSNVFIQNNFLNNNMVTLDEGAVIYTFLGKGDQTTFTNILIDGNIVLNTMGTLAGRAGNVPNATGIYGDVNSKNLAVTNNTVAHSSTRGLLFQDNQGDTISGNVIFDAGSSLMAIWTDSSGDFPSRNHSIHNNVFVQLSPIGGPTTIQNNNGLIVLQSNEVASNAAVAWGVSSNNTIAWPQNFSVANGPQNNIVFTSINSVFNHYQLAGPNTNWKNTSCGLTVCEEVGSVNPVLTTTDPTTVILVYNNTTSPTTTPLNGTYSQYVDPSVNSTGLINGLTSITLQPFRSAVLIKTSSSGGGGIRPHSHGQIIS